MQLTTEQQTALSKISDWLDAGAPNRYFVLHGYAGTGKTTITKIMGQMFGKVMFAAYTGKAASVLRRKGCPTATTIHKILYTPTPVNKERIRELRERLELHPGDKDASSELHLLLLSAKAPRFNLNPSPEAMNADLIVIDECSMVGEKIGRELLSLGRPVVAVGDPFQLPPVKAKPFFRERADYLLEKVHRFAEDSIVTRVSRRIREDFWVRGEGAVPMSKVTFEDTKKFDQVIVGRNATRRHYNRLYRESMGKKQPFPEVGERLICLKNSAVQVEMQNGTVWEVLSVTDLGGELVLDLTDGNTSVASNLVSKAPFIEDEPILWSEHDNMEFFDYAYAITAHKAQGSQWPNVFVKDEGVSFRQDRWRWLYTAVTRAEQNVLVGTT